MPELLITDRRGRILRHPVLEAAGMEGGNFFRLGASPLIKMPPESRLLMLPDRAPAGYDPGAKEFVILKGHRTLAVFTPPAYTVTHNAAYREMGEVPMLPLFSYAACAFLKGKIYVAAMKVDRDIRHDLRFIDLNAVKKNLKRIKKIFPHNRLVNHLGRCALNYGCPNAQNFFLSRFEGPLPTSPRCNAGCSGCISYQPRKGCVKAAQPRIDFMPTAEEVAEIAIFHINNTKDPIVSFGQGCEGEPLLAGEVVERAIRLIREKTSKGIININTNASLPRTIARLFDAGLDSMRVSMNSARDIYYTRYYRPRGYDFKDVLDSIRTAKKKGGFVSLNYLTMPGFTDSKDEFAALRRTLHNHPIDMIQWRNLNHDPARYFRVLKLKVAESDILGIREAIQILKKDFPRLKMGYFNPSKISLDRLKIR